MKDDGRKTARTVLAAAALLMTALISLGAAPTEARRRAYGPGEYDFSLKHDGLTRTFVVHVPPGYDAVRPMPLVMAFHGGGGNAQAAARYFRLDEKADREGFIVVYPQGTGRVVAGNLFGTWNAGRCCQPAMGRRVDDVGFVRAMLRKLERYFLLDEKRVYATGFSNGAQMAFRLACEMSDTIAAVAVGGSVGTFDNCRPRRPVPVFIFDGTRDPCSPHQGSDRCGGCVAEFFRGLGVPVKDTNTYTCESVSAYLEKWAKLDGCDPSTRRTSRRGNTVCTTYGPCKDSVQVTACLTEGSGHTWPGNTDYGIDACLHRPQGYVCRQWKRAVGPLNTDYDATYAIWEFLKRYSRK